MKNLGKRCTAGLIGIAASAALVTPAFAGSAAGSGAGAITAHGRGAAQLSGDVDAMGISGTGVLVVVDNAGDAHVAISGHGVVRVSGHTRTYIGFNGRARISGSNVTVKLVGENVTLAARGDGSFVLKGTGTYDTKPGAAGGEGTWSRTGTSGEF